MLLVRTTRAMALTPAGACYLANIEPILAAFEEANFAAQGGEELRGRLRLGIQAGISLREVIPKLSAFLDCHSTLSVDLVLDQPCSDGLRAQVDLALQIVKSEEAKTAMRLITSTPRVLVASPKYLLRKGMPSSPAALIAHSIIVGPSPSGGRPWLFSRNGKAVSLSIDGKINADACEMAMAAAVSGAGILSTGLSSCQAEIDSGILIRVLEGWDMGDIKLYASLPAGAASKTVARFFISHLASEFHKQDLYIELP